MDYYIHNLTANVLKQFINWELWNSLPCRTLVSILSRRFTTYILTFLSAPGLLNHNIIQLCGSAETKTKVNLDKYYFVSLSNVDHTMKESSLTQSMILIQLKENHLKTEKIDKSGTPVMSPRRISKEALPDFIKSINLDELDSSTIGNTEAFEINSSNSSPKSDDAVKTKETDEALEVIVRYCR